MKRNYMYIVLAYGLFLGWLLSFPYNGPVLKHLVLIHQVPIASFSLVYTVVPAVFLIIYLLFFQIKEEYAKNIMNWSITACIVGTVILFTLPTYYWYPVLAVMGIGSVMYIIGWSYYYTMEIPIDEKMRIMALVIIIGNSIYYVINILHDQISIGFLLAVIIVPLIGAFRATSNIAVNNKIAVELEHEPLPVKLIFVICSFLFAVNITDGLTFHAIYPSFDQLFVEYFTFYGIMPYIITLVIIFFFGTKLSIMFPVFLGTSVLGLAYLSFGLMGKNWYSYFITETFLQMGWALLDLVLWTLFGLIASIYGRPLKICGYAFLANLLAVFAGGLLAVRILNKLDNYFIISAAFAIGIIFISFLIVPWLSEAIEKDLRNKLFKTNLQNKPIEEISPLSIPLPQREILTPREREIAELLIQGFTNKQIADLLHISENTIKTHTRKIYSKLDVANKRELLQLSFSSRMSKGRSS
ncbi:MAG: hypothetical protein VR72_08835 [Clostridiaceae bacterium BRH_c20a]|nr:MAG: hypothetical protein VR72_08835 [Clostridiaceae bacterium BRH_c20a]